MPSKRNQAVAIIQHSGAPLSPLALSLASKSNHVDRLFYEDEKLYHKGRVVSSDILSLYDLVHDETNLKNRQSYLNTNQLPIVDVPRHIPTTRERASRAALMMDNRKISLLNIKTPHRAHVSLTGDTHYDGARLKELVDFPFVIRPSLPLLQARDTSTSTRTISSDNELHKTLRDHSRSVIVEEHIPGVTAWVLIIPGLRGALTYTAIPVGRMIDGSYKPLSLSEPLKSNLLHSALETAEALFVERMILASFRLSHTGEIILLKVNPFPSELEEKQFIASLSGSGITYDELTENIFDNISS